MSEILLITIIMVGVMLMSKLINWIKNTLSLSSKIDKINDNTSNISNVVGKLHRDNISKNIKNISSVIGNFVDGRQDTIMSKVDDIHKRQQEEIIKFEKFKSSMSNQSSSSQGEDIISIAQSINLFSARWIEINLELSNLKNELKQIKNHNLNLVNDYKNLKSEYDSLLKTVDKLKNQGRVSNKTPTR